MSEGGNRIGTISSVDLETGMVSVLYEDRGGEVTELLPYATFNDEYKLPKVGAKVVVIHLSNGGEMGVVLGTYWNKRNLGKKHGAYHKEIGEGAYYDFDKGTLSIAAEHIRFICTNEDKELSVADLIADITKIKQKLNIL